MDGIPLVGPCAPDVTLGHHTITYRQEGRGQGGYGEEEKELWWHNHLQDMVEMLGPSGM